MRGLSNRYLVKLGALLIFGATVRAGAVEQGPPPNALILFGANWCAPCLAELRDLPAWGTAMAPALVLIAWTEGQPPMLWRQWPGNARLLAPGEAAPLLGQIGGKTAGLPYVALLDAEGKLCAELRGKLNPARLEAMKARCRAS